MILWSLGGWRFAPRAVMLIVPLTVRSPSTTSTRPQQRLEVVRVHPPLMVKFLYRCTTVGPSKTDGISVLELITVCSGISLYVARFVRIGSRIFVRWFSLGKILIRMPPIPGCTDRACLRLPNRPRSAHPPTPRRTRRILRRGLSMRRRIQSQEHRFPSLISAASTAPPRREDAPSPLRLR